VDLHEDNASEKTYHITCHVSREHEPEALLIKFYITLDIPVLLEKLKTNHSLMIKEYTILTFIKKKNIDIIPHMKLYNGSKTDYDEIAGVFYNSRGDILLDRFGI
jgi:hypothetical protein